MRKSGLNLVILGVGATLALAACSSSAKPAASSSTTPPATTSTSSSSGANGAINGNGAKVGIILPDTTSSPRWITADPTALQADCTKDNLTCDIQNAGGSTTKMEAI